MVYQVLLKDLVNGVWAPGSMVNVKENAARLRISSTPVREALERLVGEGMVSVSADRTGFVVPRLGLTGYLSLTETFVMLAKALLRDAVREGDIDDPAEIEESDPAGSTDALFRPIFSSGSNPAAEWIAVRLGNMLGPYRRAEPSILPDWASGMRLLCARLPGPGAASALRGYLQTRRQHAAVLVDHVERGHTHLK